MKLTAICCPECQWQELKIHTVYKTKSNGNRVIYICSKCGNYFSETKNTVLEGLRTAISLIVLVIKARTEGMGLNAASRTYEVSKSTILSWERRLGALMPTLMLYALSHQFLQMIIEGDEVYTRVEKNIPPDQCRGWTIVFMDRATRFIWELKCGRKDRKLFKKAMRTLSKVVEKTQDLSLITDGEKRYASVLFEICHELLRTGRQGRPRKVLCKGVKVRRKNKGSQAHKKGRKCPKYQAPCKEHPQTQQNIEHKDIHANHVEGFNSSLRRRNAAYRRKTNTYAKADKELQRTLDVYWIIHNFVRPHFTTKKVPAVALGIIEKGLSWKELFAIQRAA